MTTKVYVAYHRWAPRVEGGPFTPIHVGRVLSDAPLRQMIGDDTGENLSAKNDAWCELTALYWAWKNDLDSDRIGLMHYRRVLDLLEEGPTGQTETLSAEFDVQDWAAKAGAWLNTTGTDADIIVPRLHVMGSSVEENYKRGHAPQDWDLARDIIAADHPDYLATFDDIAAGHSIRLGNIAVMTRDLFDRYCALLFGVLQKVEAADVDRSNYSAYQGRYLGFLAERLLTMFVEHERRTNPSLRLKEVGILNLERALVTPYLIEADRPASDVVNIALSADRAYLPHAAAMLRSLMDHADPVRPINLFFLHSGLDERDLDGLRSLLRERPGTALHPIDTYGMFANSYRSASRAPSNATYCRFLLFSLLPGLERLLYLDGDMIINADICALYDTDMGDAQIAAVTDWIMTRTLTGPTQTADPDVPDLGAYHRNALGMTDVEIARYFNAGVLLFNFANMDDPKALGAALLEEAETARYLFRDQDILNKAFKGSLHQLDARWNVFNSDEHVYTRVPKPLWDVAKAARSDPWIIHYADRSYKPWGGNTVPLADRYWQALMRTPYFSEVITGRAGRKSWNLRDRSLGFGRMVAVKLPFLKRPLLKLYYLFQKRR